MLRICISGLGKTGLEIARAILEQKDMKLVSAVCSPESSNKGKDVGTMLGIKPIAVKLTGSDELEKEIFKKKPDVVIDFSNPNAVLKNAQIFSKLKVNMIIGTTGFSKIGQRRLQVLAKRCHTGIVYAPNITLGVNVLMFLANLTANILNDYDFEIMEIHHKHKKDSPSGTAKKIAAEITKGLNSSGVARNAEDINITAVRAGGVVGKHEILVVGENDKIEISHESFNRKAFALGAIRAARFISGKTGFYEMSDVLDLDKVLNNYLSDKSKRRGFEPSNNWVDINKVI